MCGKKCRTNDFLNKHVALSFLMDEPFGIISDLTDKNAFLSTTSFWANAKKWYAQPFVFFSLRDGLSWSLSKKTCCCGGVVHSRDREIWKTAGFRHFFYWNSLTGYLFQTTYIPIMHNICHFCTHFRPRVEWNFRKQDRHTKWWHATSQVFSAYN